MQFKSRYGRIPCTAVTIMIDISSLEHVLKCLNRQNILTELTLDSSLELLDIMFFSWTTSTFNNACDPKLFGSFSFQSPEIAVHNFLRHKPQNSCQKSCILRPKKYNFKNFLANLSCDYVLYTSRTIKKMQKKFSFQWHFNLLMSSGSLNNRETTK